MVKWAYEHSMGLGVALLVLDTFLLGSLGIREHMAHLMALGL